MKVNLDRGNKNKYRASRSFSIRSANGEWCKYVSLDECATAERAKFVEDVRQRERVDGGGFFADIGDAGQQDIFDNLVAIPLTDGCNGRCKFCSVCAKPGIRKQMTYNSALWIIQQFTEKSRQTDMQKSQLLLYYDTDPLDWEEVDESGQTVHDFYKLSRMISQKHRTTKTAGVTHVPPHGVKGLLNQMSDEIVVAANSPGINAYPLNVSISEDNDDMIAVFRRDLIEEVIRKLDDPECDNPENRAMLRKETNRLFYDRRVEGSLLHIGRNYPGDHVPVQDLAIQQPFSEGVYIDPNGIRSIVYVLPTENNPTGTLEMSYSETKRVFKRTGYARPHIESTLKDQVIYEEDPSILPSLRNSIVGDPEDLAGDILTPRNELLREAFAWRNFECSILRDIQKFGRARFESELKASGTLDEIRARWDETIEILNRTYDSDERSAEYLTLVLNQMSDMITLLRSGNGTADVIARSAMQLFGLND